MVRALGRPAAGVDGGELAGLGIPIDGEQIAAHAVALRLDHAQHGVGRDGRVHGRTAARQNLRSRLRSQRLAGGHDAALRHHHRARLRTFLGVSGKTHKTDQR